MKPILLLRKPPILLSLIVATVIVLLPFHAVFTTWLGSNLGHLDLIRIWKELLLVGVMVPLALLIAWQSPELRKWLLTSWIPRLFAAYVLLHLILGIWALSNNEVNRTALIYALLVNLRFICFFLVCFVAAASYKLLKQKAHIFLIVPALLVISFGLLQILVLPHDFLRHLGYGPETIPAYQTVDSNLDYQRIQSTLRGANPLGAYLVLIIPAIYALVKRPQYLRVVSLPAALVILFFTYSRSAWAGAFISLGILIWWSSKKRYHLLLSLIAILVVAFSIFMLSSDQTAEKALFHTDDTSVARSSNDVRLQSLKSGATDVVNQPTGRGPGTAGPASFRNDRPVRIAENYYLQIGQEIGLLGMAVFIAINVIVGVKLWYRRQNPLALVLFASLVGLTFVNLISHAWTDDTISYIWWGLAGIVLAPDILRARHKQNGKNYKT